ncbi:MAG: hypothetical protein M3186_05105 [Actinomycetota bacterium]|nr:hypothetical protein [Actinomycetota bacterium]
MADHETTGVGCGEPELSQELREALTLLREHSDDNDFRTLVDDVLAGRSSLFEASGTAAFSNVVFASIAQEFAALTEDEKRRLAAPAESSGTAATSCGLPCAGCTSVCAALRANQDH